MGILNQIIQTANSAISSYNCPKVEEVISFIKRRVTVAKSQYKEEKNVENIIAKQLREKYGATNVHQQYSVQGFLGLKCDIDLFDSKCCGIELKLAKQLSASSGAAAKERLIGQAVYYSRRQYKGKLIVLVVGTANEKKDAALSEVEKFLLELGIYYIYKEIQ